MKWSLIGERNWTSPKADGPSLSLEGVYPLNAADHQGGTNVWEIDLETRTENQQTSWKLRAHGSNGATALSEGRTKGDVRLALDADADLILPASQPLARIGDTTLQLTIPR